MRATRTVSLAALTLAAVVGSIGAAAADTASTHTVEVTSAGTTSSYSYSNDHSHVWNWTQVDAAGVSQKGTATGYDRYGNAFYFAYTRMVGLSGVKESTTLNTSDHHGSGWDNGDYGYDNGYWN